MTSFARKLQLLLLVTTMFSSSARVMKTVVRGGDQQQQLHGRKTISDALFNLELIETEDHNLEIPGEDKRYYTNNYHNYYEKGYYGGKGGKGSKSSKSGCKCGKSKKGKSKKGGYHYGSYGECDCDGAYYPPKHPGKPNDGYWTKKPSNPGYGTNKPGYGTNKPGYGTNQPGYGHWTRPGGGGGTTAPDTTTADPNGSGGGTTADPDSSVTTQKHPGGPYDEDGDGDGGEGYTPGGGGAFNCEMLRKGKGATNGMQVTLYGKLQVVFYAKAVEKDEVLAFIYDVMNKYVRIWMGDCEVEEAKEVEEEKEEVTYLAKIFNIVMSHTIESKARGACTTKVPQGTCMKTDTPTTVYHGMGDTTYLAKKLSDAIKRAIESGKFAGMSGLHSVIAEDGTTVYHNPDASPNGEDGTTVSTKATSGDDDGLGVAAKTVIPIAAVTLFLLAILFLRKKHRDNVARTKSDQKDSLLDTDTDEETNKPPLYVNESSDESTVTDGGSYFEDSILAKNQSTMDVHVCQSSLCEACDRNSGGISFIKTGAPPSPERLPTNATRDYSESDTVSL